MTEKEFRSLPNSKKAWLLIDNHSREEQYEEYEKITFYFFDEESQKYVAVDNRTGDCWVEDFATEKDAHDYCFKEEEQNDR